MPNSHVSRTVPEAQQESFWSAPGGTLGELVDLAAARVELLLPRRRELEREAGGRPAGRAFADALRDRSVSIIAEIKRRSPSKGDVNTTLVAGDRAAAYVRGGAAAISVLTEPSRFGGSVDDLLEVVNSAPVPVLRKDFIVHEVQILESRATGASAVLLIARALAPGSLIALVRAARTHGIEPLVEVRDRDELARAVDCGADVIGVNARNLETLIIDEELPHELLGHVPRELIAVAESGIRDRAAVEALARAGADAVLVGSALSVAQEPEQAVSDLAGVARVRR